MKKIYLIFVLLLIVFSACKKSTDDNSNNNSGWTEQDQAYYKSVITLQDKAGENWTTLSQTMDSLEAIIKLQQLFLSDPSVTSATIDSLGIVVKYSNGMIGGIVLNLNRPSEGRQLRVSPPAQRPSSGFNVKSLVNIKKAIFLSPSYWDVKNISTDIVLEHYYKCLPKVGFEVQTVYKNEEASVDRFTELAGYGIIHIDSHGEHFPDDLNDTYVLTGETINDNTTKKYGDDIKAGKIWIPASKMVSKKLEMSYWVSGKFIAAHNDFSKDTVLFIGSFCFSNLDSWKKLYKQFAKGAYFGYNNAVWDQDAVTWTISLMDSLCDTLARHPYNPEKWITGSNPPKQLHSTYIKYSGDPTLTLWKDTAFYIGQSYGGGIIFYIDATEKHGLIAAPGDQAMGEWGCMYEGSIQGTSTALGTGQANTMAIVNGCSQAGIAARICDDLVLDKYSDWFLPSKDELNEMYLQKKYIGGFSTILTGDGIYYWSSSEYANDNIVAWYQDLKNGTQGSKYNKMNYYNVRAIRAF